MHAFDLNAWLALNLPRIEQALTLWLSLTPDRVVPHDAPAALLAAMRYAVLDGGKRIRPLLVLATAQALRQPGTPEPDQAALRAACAVELIHAYSLVHDDLPCMDNDVLRRGKATVHVQFGEAMGLLAGDALQALAFEILTPDGAVIALPRQAQLCALLARAAGCNGMAGGQAIDLASVGKQLSEAQLRQMHSLKTGALLRASVLMGAACGAPTIPAQRALQDFADALGLAFQVVDDMLDVTADVATLGKTPGKDAAHDKPTFVSLLGLSGAARLADDLLAQALAALARTGLCDVQALAALAKWVVQRNS